MCFSAWSGDDMVEEAFNCYLVCYFCCHVSLKIDAVSSDGASYPVGVSFMFPVIGNNPDIRWSFILWYGVSVDEQAGVRAVDCMLLVGFTVISLEQMADLFVRC